MLLEVGIDLEDGTSTLVFHTVGKGGTPITPFGSIIISSDGCVIKVVDVPSGECVIFWPTPVSAEECVAATYASSVECLHNDNDDYDFEDSDLEDSAAED